ncbi:hypothetical protein ES703_31384 [subsurface metagenome]
MWTFYRRCIFLAFRHSLGVADTATALIVALLVLFGKLSKWKAIVTLDLWWLILVAFGVVFAVRLLLAPYWIYKDRVTEVNRLSALVDNQGSALEGTATDSSPLDFSVKLETIEYRSGTMFANFDSHTQKRPPWLVAGISFRTNQVIQIATLHLEIGPTDPRDIIEPDPDAAQGFSLPHILHRAETHRFQFQLSPKDTEGEHELHLRVLAGGRWYTDGPYILNRQE